MAEFEVERVGGELKRFGVEGSDVFTANLNALLCRSTRLHCILNQ